MTVEPFTPEQQNALRVNVVLPPLVAAPLLLVMAAVLVFIYRRFGAVTPVKAFVALGALLLVAVTAAIALHIANNLRDLRAGGAQIAQARLTGKHETGRAPKTCYAEFEAVGTLIVAKDIYDSLAIDETYRIAFSPHTKRCWTVSSLHSH